MQLQKNLARLKSYIDESNSTNSNLDKIAVLEKYRDDEFIKKVLFYTYNTQFQFNVTTMNIQKNSELCAAQNTYDDLFKLLDDLHGRVITGHSAISAINAFLKDYKDYAREINYVIDRNLQTRVTASIINKTIKGLIPEFKVALGEDYDSLKKKPDLTTGEWLASRKMDGIRTIIFIDDESNCKFFSREGNEFTTFAVVAEAIKALGFKNIILDGEMCLINDDGSDDFIGIIKEFRKKDHTIENPRYRVFDVLTYEEFQSKTSKVKLSDRLARYDWNVNKNQTVDAIEQIRITTQAQLDEFREEGAEKNWEGLILRKDVNYEGKRGKNLLKVKMFIEAEFIVQDVIFAPMRVIENSKEITKDMLSAVIIEYEGGTVDVGSGFNKEEREKFYADKSLILGKEITVKYFQSSKNQKGGKSLRFPIFKCVKEKY